VPSIGTPGATDAVRLGVDGWRVVGDRTGVGRTIANIIGQWDAETVGGRFDRVTLYAPRPTDRADVPLPAGLVERVLPSRLPMLVWDNLRLAPVADDDVLWCPSYSRPLVTRAGRTVLTIYEATLKLYPEWFPRSKWYSFPGAYLRLYEWSVHHSALVLTTTEAARDDIARAYRVPRDRIRVVYLAPAEKFVPMREDPRLPALRERYLGADVPFFLFVGKMTPRRNVPKLMEAFAELRRRTSLPHKLLLVGKNTTNIDLQAHGASLGISDAFVHAGFVSDEDLVLLYNAAYAFVLPYSYEAGASLTALEAQATGCPVIIGDSPGLRETTGGVAMYLPRAEVAEMVEALTRIASDPALAAEMAERGLEFAARFSWRRTAAETLDVLREAAELPAHMGRAR